MPYALHVRRFVLAAIAAVAMPCFAAAEAEKIAAPDPLGLIPGEPTTLLGSYLAGKVAREAKDNEAAARFYREALERDPDNAFILEEAFKLAVASGDAAEAKRLGAMLVKRQPTHKIARLVLGVDAALKGDWRAAEGHFRNTSRDPLADAAATICRAWAQVGRGRPNEAFKTLDSLPKLEWAQYFERYHAALIADIIGRPKTAQPAFAAAFRRTTRNARLAEAYARHAAKSGDKALAEKILAPFVARANPHPLAKALLDEVSAGARPALIVTTPAQGMAEIFYGIGEALTGEQGDTDSALTYLQLALIADPSAVTPRYALGELYETFKAYDVAIAMFDKIPESSPLWFTSQTRKALHLHTTERGGEAEQLLKRLIAMDGQNLFLRQTLGTILRAEKRYEEAVEQYTAAIAAVQGADKRLASLYYHRGVAYERWKQWDKAEPDFKKSLEIDGEQAQVLNYLGYSWVDQNTNLPAAMALIKKAVALKPNDGFYVDSLGWAYYRQRNYKLAVKHLDRAVELQPEDPVINDHLGDAFWRVGRKREAVYQWTLALTLNPEPEERATIKRKLNLAKARNILGVTAVLNQDWVSATSRAERVFAKTLAKLQ
ncbi:MAG: tetratricopeptide repeat protein [Hyphomicrobiales bacterium]|nr:tetratricopeptide repeat protein [Hyphomicrobiales bacterium]